MNAYINAGILTQAQGQTLINSVQAVIDQLTGGGGPQSGRTASSISQVFAHHQNQPNPFTHTTTLHYQIPMTNDKIQIKLMDYDITGRLVRTLVDEEQGAGSYTVEWDGRDDKGMEAPAGIYFTRFTTGEFTQTRKIIRLR